MAAPLGRDSLPDRWSYGVCRDGRVFFISDETRTTTWLHPRSGEPVNSGHMIRSDLPRGWEEGFTDEGASYFIKFYLRINPDGTKCRSKSHMSRKTGKMVQRKNTSLNPLVVSLI